MTIANDPVVKVWFTSLRGREAMSRFSSLATELNTKGLEVLRRDPKLAELGFCGAGKQRIHPTERSQACGCGTEAELEEIETKLDAKVWRGAFSNRQSRSRSTRYDLRHRSFFARAKAVVELAGKYRLPAIYSRGSLVDEGGLMSYGRTD